MLGSFSDSQNGPEFAERSFKEGGIEGIHCTVEQGLGFAA